MVGSLLRIQALLYAKCYSGVFYIIFLFLKMYSFLFCLCLSIFSQVIEDERKQDLCGLIQEMRSIVTEQVRLTALFWMLDLLRPDPNASYTAKAVEVNHES